MRIATMSERALMNRIKKCGATKLVNFFAALEDAGRHHLALEALKRLDREFGITASTL